jgi:PPOX class probable FMN-dependent enzyme
VTSGPFDHVVGDLAALRALYREPGEMARRKKIGWLDPLSRRFIMASPFVLIATADAEGNCDVSPRGGPAGFVRVLDDHRIVIPDLSGNNLLDSLSNVIDNGHAGLLFVSPGRDETLRLEGRAWITTDPEILALWDAELRRPRAAIGIVVNSVYIHCAKSFRRGRVWDPGSWEALAAPDLCDVAPEHLGVYLSREQIEASYAADLARDRPDAP